MRTKDCECCERNLPAGKVPFTHSGRDGRPDVTYCTDCWDADCDLVGPCEYLRRTLELVTAETIKKRLKTAELRGEPTDLCERCGFYTATDTSGRFVPHDLDVLQPKMRCPGSGTRPVAEVTAQELADLYKSFGVKPPEPEYQGYRYPWCQDGQPHDPQGCDCGEGG